MASSDERKREDAYCRKEETVMPKAVQYISRVLIAG